MEKKTILDSLPAYQGRSRYAVVSLFSHTKRKRAKVSHSVLIAPSSVVSR